MGPEFLNPFKYFSVLFLVVASDKLCSVLIDIVLTLHFHSLCLLSVNGNTFFGLLVNKANAIFPLLLLDLPGDCSFPGDFDPFVHSSRQSPNEQNCAAAGRRGGGGTGPVCLFQEGEAEGIVTIEIWGAYRPRGDPISPFCG